MTRQRWQASSMRSIKRWHHIPCVEASKPYVFTDNSTGIVMRVKSERSARFYGITWRGAVRRASRWLYR